MCSLVWNVVVVEHTANGLEKKVVRGPAPTCCVAGDRSIRRTIIFQCYHKNCGLIFPFLHNQMLRKVARRKPWFVSRETGTAAQVLCCLGELALRGIPHREAGSAAVAERGPLDRRWSGTAGIRKGGPPTGSLSARG